MSQPFIGEIRMFGFNFQPRGWGLCNGQLLSIAQNTALFSILGTTYGGNGQTTFALPNLIDRAAMSQGQGPGLSPRSLGEVLGAATVTLTSNQIPSHNHTLNSATLNPANAAQNVAAPATNAMFGLSGPNNTYSDATTPNTSFAPQAISVTGSSQPHENRQPHLKLNFSIALQGIFPSRN